MYDIECPYCGEEEEINHDDGYGYEEDQTYEQECGSCLKVFAYTTSIFYDHDAREAPCLNGEDHKLKEICGFPKEFFEFKRRCEYCDEEIIIDDAKHKESMASYWEDRKTALKED